jgi:hypothetical protein
MRIARSRRLYIRNEMYLHGWIHGTILHQSSVQTVQSVLFRTVMQHMYAFDCFQLSYYLLLDRDSCTGYNHCNSSGHGRCVLSDPTNCMSKPTCVCTDGYTGPYCTEAPCKSCFSGPTCGTCKPFAAIVWK